MNLVLEKEDYNSDYLFFYDPVKNTVMDDSYFIRIIYSNEDLILNGVYLKIELDKNTQYNVLNFLDQLEKQILSKYNNMKIFSKKLREQLIFLLKKNQPIDDKIIQYSLKISGIWETNSTIGLTFKFMFIHQ